MLRNSRFKYGILLRIGGPNSLRASDIVLSPPRSTVPPSGTFTVVLKVIVVNAGCWKNIWNTDGCVLVLLLLPGPSKNCGTMIDTGNSGTVVDDRFVKAGVRLTRTKRRSAETTADTVKVTPNGYGCWLGMKNNWLPVVGVPICTSVRKNWLSATVMVET